MAQFFFCFARNRLFRWRLPRDSKQMFINSFSSVNRVPAAHPKYRVYDSDILNSRNKQLIRKEKKYKYCDFDEETAFRKEFRFGHTRQSMISNKDEINTQASVMNAADIIDNIIYR